MYENGNDYLCDKITEEELILKPKFVEGDDYTIRWWKDKAIKRYTKLYEEDRILSRFNSNGNGLVQEDSITVSAARKIENNYNVTKFEG
jgi:hypothetical protein